MIKDLVQVTLRVGTYIFEDCNRLSCQGRQPMVVTQPSLNGFCINARNSLINPCRGEMIGGKYLY